MQEPSVFTRIINGEIPSHKIYEDERVTAILTNHPLIDGHTLVIPKKQVDQIWDLPSEDYEYVWQVAQKVALHIREILGVERIGVVIKGIEIAHAHIHLIPMPNSGVHVNFDPEPSPDIADEEKLSAIAEQLRF